MLMVILHPKNVKNNYSTCKVSKFNRECAKQYLLFVQSAIQSLCNTLFLTIQTILRINNTLSKSICFGAEAKIICRVLPQTV